MAVQGKQNLPMIGKVLNHRRIETTQRYAHLDLEPVRRAIEQTTLLMVAAQTASAPNEPLRVLSATEK